MPGGAVLADLEELRAHTGPEPGRVLVVAQPGEERDALRQQLTRAGWVVEAADTVAGARLRLVAEPFRTLLVDWEDFQSCQRDGNWRRVWMSLVTLIKQEAPETILLALAAVESVVPEPVYRSAGVLRYLAPGDPLSPPPSIWLPVATETTERFLIGRSQAMLRIMEQIRLVAPKDTTVLITGETGTGKEKVSRAIHALSRRNRAAMVSVNCAGIPATLLEDEFFGHVKGAFTDAHQTRIGRFEQAHGGTLFLDEIGELPLELQPKLLRALQEREIHRVGAMDSIRLDIRVIAATNVDLWQRVEDKRFREDLFYRIKVFHIELPALRERPEDIPLFAAYFLERFSRREGLALKYLSPAAERALMNRPWRGNIRELENTIEIAVIRSESRREISEHDLLDRHHAALGSGEQAQTVPDRTQRDFRTLVQHYERELILQALQATGGNKNRAARLLRMKRTTLLEKLKRIAEAPGE